MELERAGSLAAQMLGLQHLLEHRAAIGSGHARVIQVILICRSAPVGCMRRRAEAADSSGKDAPVWNEAATTARRSAAPGAEDVDRWMQTLSMAARSSARRAP